MLAPIAQSQRVRCRQIAQSDLPELADLLTRGFSRSHRAYWVDGFARMQRLPPVEGMPRFGYVLESDKTPVGVLLLISSRRPDGRIFANLAGWYVEPGWRAHSALLIATATRHRNVTYIDASSAPHGWRTLQQQGFHLFNVGRSAIVAALSPGQGHVSEIIPGDLPERDMLHAHAAMGCLSLVCEKNGAVSPFIFKPRRVDRPPVRMMELIYCRSTDDFKRCVGPLSRHVLRRGALGFLLDGRVSSVLSHYVSGKEPRFYKGPEAPSLNDLAYTEKVIFG
jgi:hypothetical protein